MMSHIKITEWNYTFASIGGIFVSLTRAQFRFSTVVKTNSELNFLKQERPTICLLRLCVCPSVCPVWNQNLSSFSAPRFMSFIYSSKRDVRKERKILVHQFSQFANRAYPVIRSNQNYECMIWYCKFDIF